MCIKLNKHVLWMYVYIDAPGSDPVIRSPAHYRWTTAPARRVVYRCVSNVICMYYDCMYVSMRREYWEYDICMYACMYYVRMYVCTLFSALFDALGGVSQVEYACIMNVCICTGSTNICMYAYIIYVCMYVHYSARYWRADRTPI